MPWVGAHTLTEANARIAHSQETSARSSKAEESSEHLPKRSQCAYSVLETFKKKSERNARVFRSRNLSLAYDSYSLFMNNTCRAGEYSVEVEKCRDLL